MHGNGKWTAMHARNHTNHETIPARPGSQPMLLGMCTVKTSTTFYNKSALPALHAHHPEALASAATDGVKNSQSKPLQ